MINLIAKEASKLSYYVDEFLTKYQFEFKYIYIDKSTKVEYLNSFGYLNYKKTPDAFIVITDDRGDKLLILDKLEYDIERYIDLLTLHVKKLSGNNDFEIDKRNKNCTFYEE
jgi:hypothetical protein